jgi:hypothetical protein
MYRGAAAGERGEVWRELRIKFSRREGDMFGGGVWGRIGKRTIGQKRGWKWKGWAESRTRSMGLAWS